ncbi:MAG: hypothetical protein BXU00_01150 [Candidatus Nanoclepta minutus]|uniref:HEPN domain-containing protein n=1 Tax=Candidatus Nanoclepta minutus TaxID=1940235 RepID=A0A397WNP3_9ARCH|nr:MAG: hypothetical protein BXU00_01150 [Candidatus Nanoclepta minutus]
MRIHEMVETSYFLLKLYNRYANKVYNRISNPDLKLLFKISYRDDDLRKLIEEISKYRIEFTNNIKDGNLNEAYRIFKEIEKLYNSFENKIIERIESLVKIRALDIARSELR